MGGYYEDRLSGDRLRQAYAIAPPRIREYLEAEIAFVLDRARDSRRILELGCGYGRVLQGLAASVSEAVGIDISRPSLALARETLRAHRNVELLRMDAARTGFVDGAFDATVCIQNGISAFGVDRPALVAEAVRVTRTHGTVLFSSYSPRIWEPRLDWFRRQSRAGLLGEIDEARTGGGTIVCKDGFRASTVDAEEFTRLFARLGLDPEVREVDGSSLVCIVTKDAPGRSHPPPNGGARLTSRTAYGPA